MSIEKTENMLMGIAIGDSFGLGIEFQSRDWILQNVDFSRFVNKREGKYKVGYEPGFYSDDTEHSIGLVKAIIDPRPFSEELLLEKWKEEYEKDKVEKGFPRQGHGSIKNWYGGTKTLEEIRNRHSQFGPGCAPPMRAVPLGLLESDLINHYAIINANTTHSHPEARAASILVARASEHMIVRDGNPQEVIEYCEGFIECDETHRYLDRLKELSRPEDLSEEEFEVLCGPQPIPSFKHREVIGLPNSARHVAGSALYLIKHSTDAFQGLRNAINLGGDIDSIAAITTGILGGRFGLNTIPRFMIDNLEGKEKIRVLATDFHNYLTE